MNGSARPAHKYYLLYRPHFVLTDRLEIRLPTLVLLLGNPYCPLRVVAFRIMRSFELPVSAPLPTPRCHIPPSNDKPQMMQPNFVSGVGTFLHILQPLVLCVVSVQLESCYFEFLLSPYGAPETRVLFRFFVYNVNPKAPPTRTSVETRLHHKKHAVIG